MKPFFVASGANRSDEKAWEEIIIMSHVSSLNAASQIEVEEQDDPSTNSHRTQMFQDSSGEEENIGIRSEEPIYKLNKVCLLYTSDAADE